MLQSCRRFLRKIFFDFLGRVSHRFFLESHPNLNPEFFDKDASVTRTALAGRIARTHSRIEKNPVVFFAISDIYGDSRVFESGNEGRNGWRFCRYSTVGDKTEPA